MVLVRMRLLLLVVKRGSNLVGLVLGESEQSTVAKHACQEFSLQGRHSRIRMGKRSVISAFARSLEGRVHLQMDVSCEYHKLETCSP